MGRGSAMLMIGLVMAVGCRAVFELDPPVLRGDASMDGPPLPADGMCPPGYTLEGNACVDVDECALATAGCSADATCANMPGTFTCTCRPGFSGDGHACNRTCRSVLVYSDCPAPSTSCSNVPQSTYIADAASALGITINNGGTSDQSAFRTLFDAGNFDVLIIDASRTGLDSATASRIASWVNGDGMAIVTFWDLDNNTTGQTIRTALGVVTGGNYTSPQDVYRDPSASVNLFTGVEQLASPLTFTNVMADDGDALSLASTGQIVARHQSTSGSGAIAITHSGHAITLGFLSLEATLDADSDTKPDATELYTNMLGYLCGF